MVKLEKKLSSEERKFSLTVVSGGEDDFRRLDSAEIISLDSFMKLLIELFIVVERRGKEKDE